MAFFNLLRIEIAHYYRNFDQNIAEILEFRLFFCNLGPNCLRLASRPVGRLG